MPQFTLLVRVEAPAEGAFLSLLDSLAAQSYTGWELVIALSPRYANDRLLLDRLLIGRPQVRVVEGKPDELVHQTCQRILNQLGTWVGFIEQDDYLVNNALEQMALFMVANPYGKVFYSNDCYETYWGHTSFENTKGEYDPIRMRSHEYLGSLTFINVAQLRDMGGFDLSCGDSPAQDLYLRMPSPDVFVYVPHQLIRHLRTYREPVPVNPKHRLHMVQYDLRAIQNNLLRNKEDAEAIQLNGTAVIKYRARAHGTVSAYIVVDDNVTIGAERIRRAMTVGDQRFASVYIVHLGSDLDASVKYRELSMAFGTRYWMSQSSLGEVLNERLPYESSEWILVLTGSPVSPSWATDLIRHTHLATVGAVAAATLFLDRLVFPGVINHRYSGWHWNTRGRYNHMRVPHSMSTVPTGCCLLNTQDLLALGRVADPNYPTYWGMDLGVRLNSMFRNIIYVPSAVVEVAQLPARVEPEILAWRAQWSGWVDQFELHDPLS